jgi:hypothetical protein
MLGPLCWPRHAGPPCACAANAVHGRCALHCCVQSDSLGHHATGSAPMPVWPAGTWDWDGALPLAPSRPQTTAGCTCVSVRCLRSHPLKRHPASGPRLTARPLRAWRPPSARRVGYAPVTSPLPLRAVLSTWSSLCQELRSRDVLTALIRSALRRWFLGTARMLLLSCQVPRRRQRTQRVGTFLCVRISYNLIVPSQLIRPL